MSSLDNCSHEYHDYKKSSEIQQSTATISPATICTNSSPKIGATLAHLGPCLNTWENPMEIVEIKQKGFLQKIVYIMTVEIGR